MRVVIDWLDGEVNAFFWKKGTAFADDVDNQFRAMSCVATSSVAAQGARCGRR
ncbi:MAG TPA: hypothetical protein VEF03_02060 [Candidatus Binataceae bacterium]|nr:hypothetical protein [Candidatus Binataceae bacterium]